MLVTLLCVIQQSHGLHWIHRDIKPANIFLDRGDVQRIILNDWSSAARPGTDCPYVGTRLFGDRPDERDMHTPDARLDLRSLVRTAFCLSKQRLPAVEDTFAAAQQYWDEVAQNYAPFSQAMWAADAVDYDELAQLFSSSWL
jgi:serine/threonine protein kinase